jgi:pyruvate-ferredoxin/flavodoxin oxidoreductase
METRFKMLTKSNPEEAKRLITLAQGDVQRKWKMYEELAKEEDGAAAAHSPAKQ